MLADWILHLRDTYVRHLATNAKMQCTPQYSPHTHEYIWRYIRYISYYQSSFSTVSPDNTSFDFFFSFFFTGSSILPCYGRLGLSLVLYDCLPLPWDILLLLLLSRFSRVLLYETPQTAAHQALPSLGFSRQEHWSGLPFPSPWDILNPGKTGILTLNTHPLFLCSWFSIVTCQTWWLKIVHQNTR